MRAMDDDVRCQPTTAVKKVSFFGWLLSLPSFHIVNSVQRTCQITSARRPLSGHRLPYTSNALGAINGQRLLTFETSSNCQRQRQPHMQRWNAGCVVFNGVKPWSYKSGETTSNDPLQHANQTDNTQELAFNWRVNDFHVFRLYIRTLVHKPSRVESSWVEFKLPCMKMLGEYIQINFCLRFSFDWTIDEAPQKQSMNCHLLLQGKGSLSNDTSHNPSTFFLHLPLVRLCESINWIRTLTYTNYLQMPTLVNESSSVHAMLTLIECNKEWESLECLSERQRSLRDSIQHNDTSQVKRTVPNSRRTNAAATDERFKPASNWKQCATYWEIL